MSPQALIALLVVLILLTLSATPLVRDFTARQVRRVRQRVPTRPLQRVSTGTTVITASGEEVEVLEEAPPPRRPHDLPAANVAPWPQSWRLCWLGCWLAFSSTAY